jgi:hypothetical protein
MAEVDGLDEKIEDDLLLQVLYFITLFGIWFLFSMYYFC